MERFLDLARDLRSKGMDLNDVLTELRDSGATIIESVKVVREIEQVNLGQAKLIVDQSATWRDAYASNVALRDEVVRAIDGADD
jgi:ribosomal protein L7/L12